MKRLMLALPIASALFLMTAAPAAAQETEVNADDIKFFEWLKVEPEDWETGVLFAAIGLFGGLFTTFTLIGGVFPGTAGKAKLDADEAVLDTLTARLQALVDAAPPNPEAIRAVGEQLDRFRDDLRKERWRQFGLGAALYSTLGAFAATALATDVVQAFVFGTTATGVLGAIGLKQDQAARKETKDQGIEVLEQKLEEANRTLQDEREKLKRAAVEAPVSANQIENLYGEEPVLDTSPGDEQLIMKAKAV